MSLKFRSTLGGAFATLLITGFSWASCGSANCPIDTTTTEQSEKGTLRLDYSYEYINQDQPKIGRHNAGVGDITGHHDEVSTLTEIRRIGLDAALTDRFSVQVLVPFVHREHQHIHHHQGGELTETWNFNGVGDLTLLSRYALTKGTENHVRLSVIAGGVLPTGRTHALNNDGDEAETGILPGKGATSLILGGSVSKSATAKTINGLYARFPVFLSSTYQWNGTGREDYKIGNTWLANAGLVYPLFPRVGLMAQSNLRIARKDDRGSTFEEVGKTGGTFVYLSPGIQLALADGLSSYVLVQFPVYQRVNQIQLTSDSNFLAGISYRFNAASALK